MAGALTTRKTGSRLLPWRRDPFLAVREEMEDLFSRLWSRPDDEGWFGGTALPSVDVSETDNTIEVRMDLPGVEPDKIDVQLRDNFLTVSGERREEKEEKGRTFHRVERHAGRFSRSVMLPAAVAEDEVAAEYHDGVLTITLPKSEEAKARKIPVKS